ncbi:MAG: SRPBCC domain-containing protein [Bacteroidetes bacterium]|nr:SRPBCC domain-containing protein [Bacteroidota bacterium]
MSSAKSEASLYSERLIPASPDKVFKAFRDAKILSYWWGPNGYSNTFHTFEFVPGGKWEFDMHAPNGVTYPNSSLFREIQPDSLIVIEHTVKPWFLLTVTLTEKETGTLVGWNQEFESPEFARAMRTLSESANTEVLDRLQTIVSLYCR